MSSSKRFCLDTDVLIQAKNGPYSFDLAQTFWDWLGSKLRDGTLMMCKLVHEELLDGDDDDPLKLWASGLTDSDCIIEPDDGTQRIFQQIADHVNKNYTRRHVGLFLSGADPWVVALAKNAGAIVVTHEVLVGVDSHKIKIPNVCREFDVNHTNLYQMMRDLGFNFDDR